MNDAHCPHCGSVKEHDGFIMHWHTCPLLEHACDFCGARDRTPFVFFFNHFPKLACRTCAKQGTYALAELLDPKTGKPKD